MEDGFISAGQIAKKWNVSKKTVRRYCEQGMVPFAEKEGRQWMIPYGTDKPLLTRNAAVRLMFYIEAISEGGAPSLKGTGITNEQIENGYPYLVERGFITELNCGKTLKDQLKDVYITSIGKALIDDENEDRRHKGQYEITGSLRLGGGPITAEVTGKYTSES